MSTPLPSFDSLTANYHVEAHFKHLRAMVGSAWIDVETGRITVRFFPFIMLPTHSAELELKLIPYASAVKA